MKNYNKKKIITISVLAVAAVLLAGGLWVYVDSMGNSEPAAIVGNDTTQEPDGSEVPDIKIPINNEQNTQGAGSGATGTTDAGSTPSTTGSGTSGQTKTSDDKLKTPAEATPPATPEHVAPDEHEITGTDNPNVPPSSTPTPAKPETSTPQSGDTQNGKIYIPGFGWVENEGGGVKVEEAPNAGTGEIVGQ